MSPILSLPHTSTARVLSVITIGARAPLLQVMLDFHRLPLPSVSDPFALRWFDELGESWALFNPEVLHSAATLTRLRAAEIRLRTLLPPHQMHLLYRAEKSPLGRADVAWRSLARLLYGDSGGCIVRQREMWAREQAALRMQMWNRRARMAVRLRERRQARREESAIAIQRRYRSRQEASNPNPDPKPNP